MLAEPKPLLDLARRGEEVVLTEGGEPVVKMTGVAGMKLTQTHGASEETGNAAMTPEEIVAKLRRERRPLTAADMARRREWLAMVATHAAAAGTGKVGGPTTEEIIDDLREERC